MSNDFVGPITGIDWISVYHLLPKAHLGFLFLYGIVTHYFVSRPPREEWLRELFTTFVAVLTVFALPAGPILVDYLSYAVFGLPDTLRNGLVTSTAIVFLSSLGWLSALDLVLQRFSRLPTAAVRRRLLANTLWLCASLVHIITYGILRPPVA